MTGGQPIGRRHLPDSGPEHREDHDPLWASALTRSSGRHRAAAEVDSGVAEGSDLLVDSGPRDDDSDGEKLIDSATAKSLADAPDRTADREIDGGRDEIVTSPSSDRNQVGGVTRVTKVKNGTMKYCLRWVALVACVVLVGAGGFVTWRMVTSGPDTGAAAAVSEFASALSRKDLSLIHI